jgi:ABC-type bacteriocin/lantibiotic exporter with double-glycine peptidase domain
MLLGRIRGRRVPVVLQLTSYECGAACLAMILNFYGRKTVIGECREYCHPGRDGLTALIIARAARYFGLRVRAYSVGQDDFSQVPLPAIAHWSFNHFVVVERWSPTSVDVVDPAVGRRRLSTTEFDEGFTGVILAFEPGVQFDRRRTSSWPSWRSYLRYVLQARGTRGLLAQLLGASLVLQVLGLSVPVLTKVLVDQILPFRIVDVMAMLGIGLLIVVLAQLVTSYLRAAVLVYLQGRLDAQLTLGLFEQLLTLPFSFFQQRSTGDVLMRLGSNVAIREALTTQTTAAVLDGLLVLVYLAVLLGQDIMFGAFVLVLGLLQLGLLIGSTRHIHELTQRELVAEAESSSYAVEALSGIATLKASGAEDRAFDHWSNLFTEQLNVALRRSWLSSLIETANTTLGTFSPLLLLWIGAGRVLDGSMTLGTMLALNALAAAVLAPLSSLVFSGQRLQLVRAHLDRLVDVMEAAPEQDPESVQPAPELSGAIEVRQVSFQYDPHGPFVLRDISFRVAPGQKIALVGRTGSGKSTLALLLLGLYPPTSGQVLYDGIPLERMQYPSLRRQFGVVLQGSSIFAGSVRQNITFNDPTLPLERVAAAARLAAIHEEIIDMPLGYETLLAEGGTGLSGGQCQRLAVARALAHEPAILLLDEATSHLDVATEAELDRSLNALSCTRIVIAHRLSTVRNADLILVIDEGTIAELGSHSELLARGGLYAALIRGQLESDQNGIASRGTVGSVSNAEPYNPDRESPATAVPSSSRVWDRIRALFPTTEAGHGTGSNGPGERHFL